MSAANERTNLRPLDVPVLMPRTTPLAVIASDCPWTRDP